MIPFYENSQNVLRVFRGKQLNFPLHLHSQLELLYVTKSSIEVTVQKKTILLPENSLAVIFPNTIHSYSSDEAITEVITVISNVDLTGYYFNSLTKYRPEIPFICKENLHPDIPYAMEGILKESQTECNPAVYQALVQLILARSYPHLNLTKNKSTDSHDLTSQIAMYISLHFQDELSLGSVALELGVSKYYLSRIFSEKIGTGFNSYLNSIRLNYAAERLRSTQDSITDISVDSGFLSQRTFNRVFLHKYHITPMQFRNQEQENTLLNDEESIKIT